MASFKSAVAKMELKVRVEPRAWIVRLAESGLAGALLVIVLLRVLPSSWVIRAEMVSET